jgi:hypothetical protein
MPAVIISLGFELRWGVHDLYGPNLDGYGISKWYGTQFPPS